MSGVGVGEVMDESRSLVHCARKQFDLRMEKTSLHFFPFSTIYSTTFEKTLSRLKGTASGLVFLSILYLYLFVLLLFNLIPNYCTVFGAQGQDRTPGKHSTYQPICFLCEFFSASLHGNRKDVGSLSDSNEANQP